MFSTNVKAQESSVVESVVGSPITLGLIFHGIIDGISLGSSLASGEVMTLIIFAAIIIHKIPTSFSLSTISYKRDVRFKIVLAYFIVCLAESICMLVHFCPYKIGQCEKQLGDWCFVLVFSRYILVCCQPCHA